MSLMKDSKGNELLEFLRVEEQAVSGLTLDAPLTHSLIIVSCEDKFLFVHDIWKQEWELPGGCIEPGETPRQCALRELFEETQQQVGNARFLGLMKFRLEPDNRLEYGALYAARCDEIRPFTPNAEIDAITLWDLRTDIGPTAEIDKGLAEKYGFIDDGKAEA